VFVCVCSWLCICSQTLAHTCNFSGDLGAFGGTRFVKSRGDIVPILGRYRLYPALVGAAGAHNGEIKPISARDRADIARIPTERIPTERT
jgi:hypothetical protein